MGVEIPFPMSHQVNEKKLEVEELKTLPVSDSIQRHIHDQIQIQTVGGGSNLPKYNHRQGMAMTGQSPFEIETNLYKSHVVQELTAQELNRKYARTILDLAHVYSGFPIYISDSMCSRGRLYPEEPLISRTSGEFKHLLMEFTPKKVSIKGLVCLLEAYYKPCSSSSKKFQEYLVGVTLSKKKGSAFLFKFFHENYLDFSKSKDKLCYSMLLHAEILRVEKTGKTTVCLEIDQKASGVFLLANLLRNKKMAKKANVIGGVSSCPYTYCMKKFTKFYVSKMKGRDDEVFTFLTTNRKVHKYAVMCYCYSQTHLGRSEDFVDRWALHYNSLPNKKQKEVLVEFAVKFEEFFEFVFPGTKKQIKRIHQAVSLVSRELGYLPFYNLQMETFEWTFFKSFKVFRNSIHPITLESIPYNTRKTQWGSYSHQTLLAEVDKNKEIEEKEYKILKDYSMFKRKSLSYLIHCLDASLIHRFILVMRENHNYTINHLHDCVMLHPNYVDCFFDEVYKLYSSDELYNISHNLFFKKLENHLSGSSKEKLNKIKKEFDDNSDDFKDLLKEVNPRHVYEYEN